MEIEKTKQREGEHFLQKERERVRWHYMPSNKPVLQLGRQMRPMKQLSDSYITKYWSDWQPKNFFRQSPCPIVPDDAAMLDVWLSKYAYYFSICFMSDHPKVM